MAYEEREQFRILFLDKKNQLLADEVQQTGTVDHTPVYPREVIRRALELSATAIILVHNHPSGDPTPSRADIEMTRDDHRRRQAARHRRARPSDHRPRGACELQGHRTDLSRRASIPMSKDPSFDVAIVGGAAIGAAVAYFLKAVEGFPGSVALIERDPTFATAATTLSAASIRQQFSTPENIRLSRFGLEFLRAMPARFGAEADPSLRERGYLILARPEARAILETNHRVQRAEGAPVALLDAEALAARFPWLSVDGIAAGSLGLSGEGWFDAHTLLRTLRAAARDAGATLVTGEVVAIETQAGRVTALRLDDGGEHRLRNTSQCRRARRPERSRRLPAAPLPVEPRKRSVFVLDAPDAPRDMPLLADPSGIWARPEGGGFLAGYSPPATEDATADPADLRPTTRFSRKCSGRLLAARVPAFERLKVTGAWAGHYDYNTLDQNAVIGPDPALPNFLYANGFSGHGLQHAPGVGRALAELIVARALSFARPLRLRL